MSNWAQIELSMRIIPGLDADAQLATRLALDLEQLTDGIRELWSTRALERHQNIRDQQGRVLRIVRLLRKRGDRLGLLKIQLVQQEVVRRLVIRKGAEVYLRG